MCVKRFTRSAFFFFFFLHEINIYKVTLRRSVHKRKMEIRKRRLQCTKLKHQTIWHFYTLLWPRCKHFIEAEAQTLANCSMHWSKRWLDLYYVVRVHTAKLPAYSLRRRHEARSNTCDGSGKSYTRSHHIGHAQKLMQDKGAEEEQSTDENKSKKKRSVRACTRQSAEMMIF